MIEKSSLAGQYGTREHEILIGVWVIRKKVLFAHVIYAYRIYRNFGFDVPYCSAGRTEVSA